MKTKFEYIVIKGLSFFVIIVSLFTGCTTNCNDKNNQDRNKFDDNLSNINQCYVGIDQTNQINNTITRKYYEETGKPNNWKNNGYTINFYKSNGQIASEGLESNGLKNGIWIEYYENGKIKSIISYWYGREDGIKKLFYKNGQIKLEGYHFRLKEPFYEIEWHYEEIDGEDVPTEGLEYLIFPKIYKHGVWKEYNEEGALISSSIYKMGSLIEGTSISFTEDINH